MVNLKTGAINVCGVVGVDGTSCCMIASFCDHLLIVDDGRRKEQEKKQKRERESGLVSGDGIKLV